MPTETLAPTKLSRNKNRRCSYDSVSTNIFCKCYPTPPLRHKFTDLHYTPPLSHTYHSPTETYLPPTLRYLDMVGSYPLLFYKRLWQRTTGCQNVDCSCCIFCNLNYVALAFFDRFSWQTHAPTQENLEKSSSSFASRNTARHERNIPELSANSMTMLNYVHSWGHQQKRLQWGANPRSKHEKGYGQQDDPFCCGHHVARERACKRELRRERQVCRLRPHTLVAIFAG
jgi:hypothetical protein